MASAEDRLSEILHTTPPQHLAGVDFDDLARTVVVRRRRQGAATAVAASLVLGFGAVVGIDALPQGASPEDRVATEPSPPAPTPTPTPTEPSATPAVTPTPAPAPVTSGAPVVVTTAAGAGALYRLEGSSAVLVAEASPPSTGAAAVAAAVAPLGDTACVAWELPAGGSSVTCGRLSGEGWRPVDGIDEVSTLALRPDGGAIAWVDPSGEAATVRVAPFASPGVLGEVTDIAADPSRTFEGGLPEAPQSVAFAGPDALVLGLVADSDDGRGLVRLGLDETSVRAGWSAATSVTPTDPADGIYDRVGAADDVSALVVQRQKDCFCEEPAAADRAVRVSLADGSVLAVIATADVAAGRELLSVSGTPGALVYVTVGRGGLIVYLRGEGADRGVPVAGLPADTVAVAG